MSALNQPCLAEASGWRRSVQQQIDALGRTKIYKFCCSECNHTFDISPSVITRKIKTSGCNFCNGDGICDSPECQFCFNKSMASHDKSIYWSKNNEKSAREVCQGSIKEYKFDCPTCNSVYIASPNTVSNGHWCSCTINKTENKLYSYFRDNFKEITEKQKKFEWCKNKTYLPFDFCIESHKLIIELDGDGHFKQISNWSSPEINQKNDKYKMKCANEHNYSVIRVLQDDVWRDKNEWKNKLKAVIKPYKKPTIILIGELYKTSYPFDETWTNITYV